MTHNQQVDLIRRCRGFIFDLDGTIYLGEELLPGAQKVISLLRMAGRRFLFLSNKPLATRRDYAEKLTRLGIPCAENEVLNSLLVFTNHLKRTIPDARVLPVGEPLFERTLAGAGFVVTRNPDEADVVAVSFDRTFDYDKLDRAYRAAKRGAKLWATNPDKLCPMPGYELPDCGCMIAAIEAAAGRSFDLVVGKPSPLIVAAALDMLGLAAAECALAGDRLETDMAMARNSGLIPILVLTGVTSREKAAGLQNSGVIVLENIGELAEMLE
ncbi:MAG TPA: HAD-IIA family hydrolase [Candidatus Brocadiia bacterium]|nr:HAD-IIA family hydrolase [Candidatus Brocadiia bacterium]